MNWFEDGPSCPFLDPFRHKLIPPALKVFTILVPHANLLFLLGSPSPKGLLFLQALGQTLRCHHSLLDPNIIHLPQGFNSGHILSPHPIPASNLASWVLLTKSVPPLQSLPPPTPPCPTSWPHRVFLHLELTRSLSRSQPWKISSTPRIKSQPPSSLIFEDMSGFSLSSPSGWISHDLALSRHDQFFYFPFPQFHASTFLLRLFLLLQGPLLP